MDWTPPAGDKRPSWARELNMPRQESIQYAQQLSAALLTVLVAAYVTTRVVKNPRNAVRLARKRVGV